MVYKCPGEHQCTGGTYSFKSVKSDEELVELKAEGWKETLVEAMDPDKASKKEKTVNLLQSWIDEPPQKEEPDYGEDKEDTKPTREEIEQKCTELGIKFDGRNSDANLLKKIEEKLNA